jgi:NitT/TauT family transport system substrate-binding protein
MRWRPMLARWLLLAGVLAGACAPGGGGTDAGGRGVAPAAPTASSGTGTAAVAADPLAPLPPLPGKVTISYASVTANYMPAFVAADAGLFAKNGLDVDLTFVSSGPTSIQSLLGGDLQFTVGAATAPAAAYASGAPVQILMGWTPVLDSLFMVHPSITTPEQLRGKAIGVTRFGGLPHLAARLALRRWGMDPDNDVQYLQMGATPEILAGMQQGIVVGGAYAHPTNLRAQQLGFTVLGDFAEMGIPYQSGVVVGLRPYVEANPEVVRRVARAISEAIKVSVTDEDAAISAMGKFTRVDDEALLREALSRYRVTVQRLPYPSVEGLQTVIDEVAEGDPRLRSVRPQELVNASALEQLEREGFFKAVWGE